MNNMDKVMVFGTFDSLHPGHLDFLKQAKAGDKHLTVVVARDKNVLKFKGKLPRRDERRRMEDVRKTGCADRVVLGQIRNIYKVISRVDPDILRIGYDQRVDIKKLKEVFSGPIERLKPYKPEIFKSSKIK